MTTFLQLHLLTAYPPANLNRDDTGRPKTAQFGGVTRLRISSQSLKHAWRKSEVFARLLGERVGVRTQRIGERVFDHLLTSGEDEARALAIARQIAEIFGAPVKDAKDARKQTYTAQLAFISPTEEAAALAAANALAAGAEKAPDAHAILKRSDEAADIAMFGRMMASRPGFNREAAVQVAHAISTHRVHIEDDFYVAVDDRKNPDDVDEVAGTSFLGTQEFSAGTFYLYLCVDIDLLLSNLGGAGGLAADALEALVRASTTVSPGGKQNSFASRALASYALAELGSDQPRTLAAAFLRPVGSAAGSVDQLHDSVRQLESFHQRLVTVYGAADTRTACMNAVADPVSGSLDALVSFARGAIPSA